MPTDEKFWLAVAVLACGLAAWLTYRWRVRRREDVPEYVGDKRVSAVERAALRNQGVRAAIASAKASDRIPELHRDDTDRLPSLGARTQMLESLRSPDGMYDVEKMTDAQLEKGAVAVARQGLPSPEKRAAMYAALSGPMPAIVPSLPLEEQPALVPVGPLADMLEHWRTDWTWVGGKLCPPTNLIDRLPEGDWLAKLLVSA